jgi:hypothetical protein
VGGWVVLGGLLIEFLEFKFVLKLMDDNEISVIIEEGSNRVLKARKNAWRTRWLPYCKV